MASTRKVFVRLASALLVALLFAGCTSPEGGLGFARDAPAQEPYYKEYRQMLAGEHHKDFPLPLNAFATNVTASFVLTTRDQGLALPGSAPAALTVSLLAPDGTVLDTARLDAKTVRANLTATDLVPGGYLVRVDGFGASQDLDGRTYGAEYILTIEARYG